ncbi:kinase-like domain-containing protein [Rhizophagus clarus]|uniref:Kinase-like domain-containing protein n=1 Tax=Rhizophagus clarus TaxID=94130 RepID=A0A8H3R1F7_9GLOM|nr:kinase-like domain-containing protein [Rhizophagus clarus]
MVHYIWDDGKCTRDSNNTVVLKKCLYDEILNEIYYYYHIDEFILYGISQNPNKKGYVIVFNKSRYFENFCRDCGEKYTNAEYRWCKPCQIRYMKQNFINWTSKNEQIDKLIQKMQLNIEDYKDIIFEWIPYNQFTGIKDEDIFSLAKRKDGPLQCLYDEISNEIDYYFINKFTLYGISQNPDKKNYVMIFNQNQYLENFCKNCGEEYTNREYNWCKLCQKNFLKENFINRITGNEEIDNLILEMQFKINDHRDIIFEWIPYNQFYDIKKIGQGGFATVYSAKWKNGSLYWSKKEYIRDSNVTIALKCLSDSQNITKRFLNEVKAYSINKFINFDDSGEILKIYDMGSCGEASNIDETKIYGVIPYVAPKVLRKRPYTQAADIYSFGMIMYFLATGKQPFSDCAHDELLVLDICRGIRPKINEPEAPKCYIDLMKKCWDSNPINRLNVTEVEELIKQFYVNNDQFNEAEEYRLNNNDGINENNQSNTHPQAIYTSRLLNSFTDDLPIYTDGSECLDCIVTNKSKDD